MKIVSLLKTYALPIMGALALTGYWATPAAASFEWPSFQTGLKPGVSASSTKAKPPTLPLTPAAAGTSDIKASYGGLWEGWMCRRKAKDVKAAISNVTSQGARVDYRMADDTWPAFSVTLPTKFKGDVLQGTPNNSAFLTFGIRSDGYMNVKFEVPGRWWCSGILKRTKAPPKS